MGQNVQLPWEQTDFDFTVGQYLVSGENRSCQIPIRHNTLSDGDVKVCSTTVKIRVCGQTTETRFEVKL